LEEASAAELARRIRELEALVADPETPLRCRQAAEKHFNLQDGIRAYDGIYEALLPSVGARQK
jgi:hypothetical protein